MSRRMMSSGVTFIVLLGPYLFSIMDKLTQELLCPADEEWD